MTSTIRDEEFDFIRIPSELYFEDEKNVKRNERTQILYIRYVERKEKRKESWFCSRDEDEEGVSQKLHSRCPNFSAFPSGFVRVAGSRAAAGHSLPWMS